MAAIPIELAVVGLTAAASTAIPAAAAGISALVARGIMKPANHAVSDVQSLHIGDHISYKVGSRDTRHSIIIDLVETGMAKVVFLTGKRAESCISCEDLELTTQLGNLYRYEYNQLICYTPHDVAERAKSLTEEYNVPERHSTIHCYWTFFNDGKHFAIWCQTGMNFAAVLRGIFSTDYKYTVIRNIGSLREGDHIAYKVGRTSYQHGIITKINSETQVISIVYYSGKPNECPKHTNIGIGADMAKEHLYRYDYDIGVGDSPGCVVRRALNEIDKVPVNSCYSSGIEFAFWCKSATKCSLNDASTLAKARILGHVCGMVRSKRMLTIGDHIAYNSGSVYYYQHAIITGMTGDKLDVVLLPGNVSNVGNLSIVQDTVDVAEYIRKEQLYKYFYDVSDWKDEQRVTARATEQVGVRVSERPFRDPQHFAVWCKTGIYQLHEKTSDSGKTTC
jgi:hypothetical protein